MNKAKTLTVQGDYSFYLAFFHNAFNIFHCEGNVFYPISMPEDKYCLKSRFIYP